MNEKIYVFLIALTTATSYYFGLQQDEASGHYFPALLIVPVCGWAIFSIKSGCKKNIFRTWFSFRWGDLRWGAFSAIILSCSVWLLWKTLAPSNTERMLWVTRFYTQNEKMHITRLIKGNTLWLLFLLAVSTETVWRGYVLSVFESAMSRKKAFLFSSGLFSLTYLPTVFALKVPLPGLFTLNPILFIAMSLGGFFWTALTKWRSGSILPSIFSHFLFLWSVFIGFQIWGHIER